MIHGSLLLRFKLSCINGLIFVIIMKSRCKRLEHTYVHQIQVQAFKETLQLQSNGQNLSLHVFCR